MESEQEVQDVLSDEIVEQQPAESTPVETPPAEAPAETPASDEPPTPEKKNGVQKRIDELTREKYELARQTQALQEIAKRQEQELQRIAEAQRQQQLQGQKPTPDQFNYDAAAYEQALDQFYQRQYAEQRQAEERAYQQQQAALAEQQRQMTLQAQVDKAASQYADFNEVVSNPALPNLNAVAPAVVEALTGSEKFADLAYYLGKNVAEAHRIAALPPVQAVRELGKLEAMLSRPAPRQSKAPDPVPIVGGNETVDKDPSTMTFAEYKKWRSVK